MLVAVALLAGTGTWLLAVPRRPPAARSRASLPSLDATAAAATAISALVLAALGWLLFGAALPVALLAAAGATLPQRARRAAEARRAEAARTAWPQLCSELRTRTGALGESIPQALVHVGRSAPAPMRTAFALAEREWLLTTDLERMLRVLKDELRDPAADVVCETLLVAHELGGPSLGDRLVALAEDRDLELQHRRDAEARQAGARLARRFVLLVPLGMSLAGLSIGTGRSAYRTGAGQLVVAVALLLVAACWSWAGRIMRLPDPPRVLDR